MKTIVMQLLRFAHGPATVHLGDFEVRRVGFGASQLASENPAGAHAVLRRAVELGVGVIDTGIDPVVRPLIVEALFPYPSELVVMTHVSASRPDEIRTAIEDDLRALGLDQLPVVQLAWSEQPDVSLAQALEPLVALQEVGKIRHIALGNADPALLAEALAIAPIAAVQQVYDAALLAACEARGIAYIPVFPLAARMASATGGALEGAARRHNCTPSQLVIAWLLARSSAMLPVPSTNSIAHLEENMGAVHIALDPHSVEELAMAA